MFFDHDLKKISLFLLGSKVIWHQKQGKSPVFRVWNQHFYNFPPSLWSEVQLTYIFVLSIIFWFFRAIGIGLHSRDFQTLKCCHSAVARDEDIFANFFLLLTLFRKLGIGKLIYFTLIWLIFTPFFSVFWVVKLNW